MKKRIENRRVAAWALMLAVIALTVFGASAAAIRVAPHPETAVVFVSPHPDDEFQMWSLVENRPEEYKIFATMTMGDASGFCEPETYETAFQGDLGELPANPLPQGRSSTSCEEARVNSLLGFFTQMSKSDPTIPGDFQQSRTFHLPEEADSSCTEDCELRSDRVQVWQDKQGRGAVVMFDIGDGHLTVPKITHALNYMLANREDLELAPELPVGAMVGAFANGGNRCFSYPHPDHLAVEETLWNVNFGSGPQLGATCFASGRQKMSAVVSKASSDAAFKLGQDGTRLGAHGMNYGWLHQDAYPLSWAQTTLFHRLQSFWVRFN